MAIPALFPFILIPVVVQQFLAVNAHRHDNVDPRPNVDLNVIDRCWRNNERWDRFRKDLAMCSVGFAGKMALNRGADVVFYEVTDSSDDPKDPKEGTLRYGATRIDGKKWITFKSGSTMYIKLRIPIFVSNFTTIDGRGAEVHIAEGSGLVMDGVTQVIIHSLHFHNIESTSTGHVLIPGGHIINIKQKQDLDAVRILKSRRIWIDHNTFYQGKDGLVDVTEASSLITVSNNWFHDHDKVMLLGHSDSYIADKKMRVTVVYNRFGPNCNQRMPRVRFGYVHVANNLYNGWRVYAMGGGMNPTIVSRGNRFIAPPPYNHKNVTWREKGKYWNVKSTDDSFENGAIFNSQSSTAKLLTGYGRKQKFTVRHPSDVELLVQDAGALTCNVGRLC